MDFGADAEHMRQPPESMKRRSLLLVVAVLLVCILPFQTGLDRLVQISNLPAPAVWIVRLWKEVLIIALVAGVALKILEGTVVIRRNYGLAFVLWVLFFFFLLMRAPDRKSVV